MEANQQAVNDLDGYNGNHGDNMVQNLRTITDALEGHEGMPPSEALRYASRELQVQGKGSTSSYYAKGLDQAAERLEGRSDLGRGDVITLVQSLLGAVPSQGYSQQPEAGGSVFEQIVGLAANQQAQAAQSGSAGAPDSPLQSFMGSQPSQGDENPLGGMLGALLGGQQAPESQDAPESPLGALLGQQQPQGGENPLGGMLGALLGGQASQPGPQDANPLGGMLGALLGGQASQPGPQDANPLGGMLGALLGGQASQPGPQGENRPANMLQTLLPAAMSFLLAKQSGAETPEALVQAVMGLLTNRRMNPLQAGTPRSAAGGLVAQSILQALGS